MAAFLSSISESCNITLNDLALTCANCKNDAHVFCADCVVRLPREKHKQASETPFAKYVIIDTDSTAVRGLLYCTQCDLSAHNHVAYRSHHRTTVLLRRCNACNGNALATVMCLNCNERLCVECDASVHFAAKLRSHKRVPMKQKQNFLRHLDELGYIPASENETVDSAIPSTINQTQSKSPTVPQQRLPTSPSAKIANMLFDGNISLGNALHSLINTTNFTILFDTAITNPKGDYTKQDCFARLEKANPTLVLFVTPTEVCGGVAHTPWTAPKQTNMYREDSNCYLFSLMHHSKINPSMIPVIASTRKYAMFVPNADSLFGLGFGYFGGDLKMGFDVRFRPTGIFGIVESPVSVTYSIGGSFHLTDTGLLGVANTRVPLTRFVICSFKR